MNQRKLGIFLSYLNITLQSLLGFLYIPVLLHYIGKSEYGLYQLMGSLIAYFGIMDFGLSAAVIRFYAKYLALKDQVGMENILAIALRCYGAVMGVILIAGGAVYTMLDAVFSGSMTAGEVAEAKDIFLLLLLNIVITLSTMVFRSVINAHERFLFLKGMETVQLVLQPMLVVLLLMHHPNAFSVALVQTGLNLVLSLARVYYCFAKLHVRIRYHYWSHELMVSFRRLALSVFAVTLIDQVFWKTNQIILGVISGTAAVAVYSTASIIYRGYMQLSVAISGVYLPHVMAMVAEKATAEKLSALFIQIGRWQYYFLALVATGFILFGERFIRIWAGKGFEEAYGITLLIILPFTIDLIQNVGLSILQAENRYDFRAKVYFVTGLFNLALAIPLGMAYGGTGCAFATGLSMFLGNGLVMNWFYAKEIHLAIASFWQQIGRISLTVFACLIAGLGLVSLPGSQGIGRFLVEIGLYTFFYSVCIYLFAMNDGEREKVRGICGRTRMGRRVVLYLDRGEESMMRLNISKRLEIRGGYSRSKLLIKKFLRHRDSSRK